LAQLLVLYDQPSDPETFEQYYFNTHLPIFAKAPGIKSVTISRAPITTLAGSSNIYLLAEVMFDSMSDLQTALHSEAGQAAVADLQNFAAAGVTILAFETRS
jgi:uncharacterized protein (TIGR02118 family)